MDYFIDESGNTGDLILTERDSSFANQEYFSLACIGIESKNLKLIGKNIIDLKKKYKIQAEDLKLSKIIFDKKLDFVFDVLKLAIELNCKFLVEVVDKKFVIAANIVEFLLYPPYYTKDNDDTRQYKKFLADYLYAELPVNFFIKFTKITREPTEEHLICLFQELKQCLNAINSPISTTILSDLEESFDDFQLMKNKNNLKREAFTYFLPLPDTNKKGEKIGILPHISSYTNILSRINVVHNGNVSNLNIIHDQQNYLDDIIRYYHNYILNNQHNVTYNPNPNSNYKFLEDIDLSFDDSLKNIGIQIADLFAGFSNRFIKFVLQNNINNIKENKIAIEIFQILARQNNLELGQGFNFVSTSQNQEKLFDLLPLDSLFTF